MLGIYEVVGLFCESIEASRVNSKICSFLKQSLAFFSFKHLATLGHLWTEQRFAARTHAFIVASVLMLQFFNYSLYRDTCRLHATNLADFELFFLFTKQAQHPGVPAFVYGHSMGGMIAVAAVIKNQAFFKVMYIEPRYLLFDWILPAICIIPP